jgi:hypothetical protein
MPTSETAERGKRIALVIMLIMGVMLIWLATEDTYLPALRKTASLLNCEAYEVWKDKN